MSAIAAAPMCAIAAARKTTQVRDETKTSQPIEQSAINKKKTKTSPPPPHLAPCAFFCQIDAWTAQPSPHASTNARNAPLLRAPTCVHTRQVARRGSSVVVRAGKAPKPGVGGVPYTASNHFIIPDHDPAVIARFEEEMHHRVVMAGLPLFTTTLFCSQNIS